MATPIANPIKLNSVAIEAITVLDALAQTVRSEQQAQQEPTIAIMNVTKARIMAIAIKAAAALPSSIKSLAAEDANRNESSAT